MPAPKSANWHFVENTCPEETTEEFIDHLQFDTANSESKFYCLKWVPLKQEKIKLRPLAHISIQEQTIMTLVMMCLANDVEALQGALSIEYYKAHEKKVVSYGNRLYCTYNEDSEGKLTAEHNYGATTIYSKYFTDYRKFLQRPYHFAAKALPKKSPDEEVYLVELGLNQFFDLIDREKLLEKISNILLDEQNTSITDKDNVHTLFSAFKDWGWSASAKEAYHLCAKDDVKVPRNGLPQGLVASGPPVMAPIVAEIYGPDYAQQIKAAKLLRTQFSNTDDIVDVDDMTEADQAKWIVRVDRQRASGTIRCHSSQCRASNKHSPRRRRC